MNEQLPYFYGNRFDMTSFDWFFSFFHNLDDVEHDVSLLSIETVTLFCVCIVDLFVLHTTTGLTTLKEYYEIFSSPHLNRLLS